MPSIHTYSTPNRSVAVILHERTQTLQMGRFDVRSYEAFGDIHLVYHLYVTVLIQIEKFPPCHTHSEPNDDVHNVHKQA